MRWANCLTVGFVAFRWARSPSRTSSRLSSTASRTNLASVWMLSLPAVAVVVVALVEGLAWACAEESGAAASSSPPAAIIARCRTGMCFIPPLNPIYVLVAIATLRVSPARPAPTGAGNSRTTLDPSLGDDGAIGRQGSGQFGLRQASEEGRIVQRQAMSHPERSEGGMLEGMPPSLRSG